MGWLFPHGREDGHSRWGYKSNHHSGHVRSCRNMVFLSVAASYADALDITDIFIGVSEVDYSGYVDCREEFIRSMEQTINLGTVLGAEKKQKITLHAPFMHMTNADEVRLGNRLGVDYASLGLVTAATENPAVPAIAAFSGPKHLKRPGNKRPLSN